jgi:ribosomal RNA-processing protein 8
MPHVQRGQEKKKPPRKPAFEKKGPGNPNSTKAPAPFSHKQHKAATTTNNQEQQKQQQRSGTAVEMLSSKKKNKYAAEGNKGGGAVKYQDRAAPPPSQAPLREISSKYSVVLGGDDNDEEGEEIANKQQKQANTNPSVVKPTTKTLTPLQSALHQKLSGSRFRTLNESLYTNTSSNSLQTFQDNEQLFVEYHQGFRAQVLGWDFNPVDLCVDWVRLNYGKRAGKSGKNGGSDVVIGDFGCGDAVLGQKLTSVGSSAPLVAESSANKQQKQKKQEKPPLKGQGFTVHSFDLVAPDGLKHVITPCDNSDVPLPDCTLDAAIYCLSLVSWK